MVYRTALRLTESPEDAEDVLQTIFLRLLKRELTPELKQGMGAYLYRAAVNLSLNTIRNRERFVSNNSMEWIDSSRVDTVDNKLYSMLFEALAQLKPKAA